MIDKIDILHESHCGDFSSHPGKKAAGLLCVVSYHHKIVVELGEYCFDSFSEALISPCGWFPILLIQPVWDLQGDVCNIKKVLLHLSTEITFVSKHHTVMVLPSHIVEIMEVMDTRRSHVIGMDYTTYPTDCVKFISIIMQTLRGAITPIGRCVDVVTPHCATSSPCVPADLDRFGVDAEYILAAVYGHCDILADIFCKSRRQFAPCVELPAADKVWQVMLAFVVEAVKEQVLAVKAKRFGCYPKGYDLEVGKLRNNPTSGYITKFIYTISGKILAYSEDSYEIYDEVAHRQSNGS